MDKVKISCVQFSYKPIKIFEEFEENIKDLMDHAKVYVIHSCMVGPAPLGEMKGWGRSSILSPCELPWNPNGIIAEAPVNKECVISVLLDLKVLHKKRKRGVAPTLKDRRPEIYQL